MEKAIAMKRKKEGAASKAAEDKQAQDRFAEAEAGLLEEFHERRKQVIVHIGTSASTFALNIHAFANNDMQGTVLHLYTNSAYRFHSLFEAFLIIQEITDRLEFPQSGYMLRSWVDAGGVGGKRLSSAKGAPRALVGGVSAAEALRSDEELERDLLSDSSHGEYDEEGGAQTAGVPLLSSRAKITFVMRIHYKQNASWQGEVQCSAYRAPVQFRSVLELAHLVWEAGLAHGEKERARKPRGNI